MKGKKKREPGFASCAVVEKWQVREVREEVVVVVVGSDGEKIFWHFVLFNNGWLKGKVFFFAPFVS